MGGDRRGAVGGTERGAESPGEGAGVGTAGRTGAADDEDWPTRLRESLIEEGDTRVALIGTLATRLAGEAVDEIELASRPRFASLADCARAAPAERQADVALLTLDALGRDEELSGRAFDRALDRALGIACRLYPSRLLLFVGAARAPAPERLFAFGFRRLIVRPDATLYEYRLRDYKTPPEWLNARFWANPERFDLDEEEEEDDEDESADDEADAGSSGGGR